MLFCCRSTSIRVAAGSDRAIFFDLLKKSYLARILQLLMVGANESECRPKEKFNILWSEINIFLRQFFELTKQLCRDAAVHRNVASIALLIRQI